MVHIPEHIRSLKPYVAGKTIEELAREKGLSRIVKLASNENPNGPSPRAIEAALRVLDGVHRYVDPTAYELRRKISQRIGRKPEQVLCGAGTDSLLAYMITAFSEAGDEVLTSAGSFIGIYVNTNKQGRKVVEVPMTDYRYDLASFPAAVTERTRIVYIANPNNPTGSIITASEFERLMESLPTRITVILDEAYSTYARGTDNYPDGLSYDYPNLLVTRTFSKDYGLAGLRLGFASGPEDLIQELAKAKLPFEPSLPAQNAGIAALDDEAYIANSVETNNRNLERMTKHLEALGVAYVPTRANFLLMVFDDEAQAAGFNQACLNKGLILRHTKGFGVANGVRMNSGTDDETTFALNVITDVCAALNLTRSTTSVAGSAGNPGDRA